MKAHLLKYSRMDARQLRMHSNTHAKRAQSSEARACDAIARRA